jgi:hypothetical protein
MTPADLRAAVLAGLAAVEDLAAEVGLGLQSVADQVEAAHLAAALADARAPRRTGSPPPRGNGTVHLPRRLVRR